MAMEEQFDIQNVTEHSREQPRGARTDWHTDHRGVAHLVHTKFKQIQIVLHREWSQGQSSGTHIDRHATQQPSTARHRYVTQ